MALESRVEGCVAPCMANAWEGAGVPLLRICVTRRGRSCVEVERRMLTGDDDAVGLRSCLGS